jgi:hypothetical protein
VSEVEKTLRIRSVPILAGRPESQSHSVVEFDGVEVGVYNPDTARHKTHKFNMSASLTDNHLCRIQGTALTLEIPTKNSDYTPDP